MPEFLNLADIKMMTSKLRELYTAMGNVDGLIALANIESDIDCIEPADVKQVVRASWSDKMVCVQDAFGDFRTGYQCSNCKGIFNKTLFVAVAERQCMEKFQAMKPNRNMI